MVEEGWCGKRLFGVMFTRKRSICQDRLGINRGKVEGKGVQGGSSPLTGQEMGLPKMSLPEDAAAEFQAMKAALDATTTDDGGGVAAATADGLPEPSADAEQLRSDIETHGYCIIDRALSAEAVRSLTERTLDQAAAEAAAGLAAGSDSTVAEEAGGEPADYHSDDNVSESSRYVRSLPNKGGEFVSLLLHTQANGVVRYVLGEEYQLSHASAKYVAAGQTHAGAGAGAAAAAAATAAGGALGDLRMDQWWLPQPLDRAQMVPKVRLDARRSACVTF
jgi:hypothetical protein